MMSTTAVQGGRGATRHANARKARTRRRLEGRASHTAPLCGRAVTAASAPSPQDGDSPPRDVQRPRRSHLQCRSQNCLFERCHPRPRAWKGIYTLTIWKGWIESDHAMLSDFLREGHRLPVPPQSLLRPECRSMKPVHRMQGRRRAVQDGQRRHQSGPVFLSYDTCQLGTYDATDEAKCLANVKTASSHTDTADVAEASRKLLAPANFIKEEGLEIVHGHDGTEITRPAEMRIYRESDEAANSARSGVSPAEQSGQVLISNFKKRAYLFTFRIGDFLLSFVEGEGA
eukprot:6205441-Pleurochrysis_carterae.AAC.5